MKYHCYLAHHLAQVDLVAGDVRGAGDHRPAVTLSQDGTVNKVHFWDDARKVTKFMVADVAHMNHHFGINILSILQTIWQVM